MLVKIVKDNKKYNKDEYVYMSPFDAKKYIKKGIAEEAPEHWVPGQLVIAELFTATRIYHGSATEGEHKRWAVLCPYVANIPGYRTLTETKYRHVLTGISMRESHPTRNLWGAEGLNQVIVNTSTIKPFVEFFMNYMIEHDMDKNTIMFKEDIKKFECLLNKTTEKSEEKLQD